MLPHKQKTKETQRKKGLLLRMWLCLVRFLVLSLSFAGHNVDPRSRQAQSVEEGRIGLACFVLCWRARGGGGWGGGGEAGGSKS